MCGIAGIYNFEKQNSVDAILLSQISSDLSHRGPDENGVFIDKNIGLAHRRLSIIDLSTGSQPMHDIDENYTIVFNGEIYNYHDLKDELNKSGYQFITKSDTEVVLNSFKEWGINCFERFNGEWAIAIWDKKLQQLVISRDRYGIKPLYYLKTNKSLFFSSEIKAFYHWENISIDKNILWDQLVFGPIDYGKTFIKGVEVLKPGTILIAKNESVIQSEYYKLETSLTEYSYYVDHDEIEHLLVDSIERRLMSDVSLATINSGGIDSSLISAIAQKKLNGGLFTFSVAPEVENGKKLHGDESYYAQIIADFIKSKHHTIRYSRFDFVDEIEMALFYNDSILFHSNSIPLSSMFKGIKNDFGVTVALGGEGADEIFRGYSINNLAAILRKADSIYSMGLAFEALKYKYPKLKVISEIVPNQSPFAKLAMAQNMFLTPETADKLLGINGSITNDRFHLIEQMNKLPNENQLIYYEQRTYLYGLLQRADRMAMRWSLEARVPFLDHRLVDALNAIHPKLKSGFSESSLKKILKNISINYIPDSIVKRKKFGFSSPLIDYKKTVYDKINASSLSSLRSNYDESNVQDIFILYNYQLLSHLFSL